MIVCTSHLQTLLLIIAVFPLPGFASPAQRSSNATTKTRELITAANDGNLEKVTRILDSGFNINARINDRSELSGRTALMIASLRGYERIVDVLLSRKANVNLKDEHGETALLLAMNTPNLKIVKALIRAGANPNVQTFSPHAGEITPLIRAINAESHLRLELTKTLLEAKAEVNPKGKFAGSPLLHAVEDLEITKLLISYGANVEAKNFRGTTPLMIAAGAGDISVVRYLIERGADVNARDNDGYTVLTYAEQRREVFDPSRREEIIRLLKTLQTQPKPR